MSAPFITWVIYDHPSDYPAYYVARKWVNEELTKELMYNTNLEVIRCDLASLGLVHCSPLEDEDPVIKEIWI